MRRLVLTVVALVAVLAATAFAGTTRTTQTPEQIRAYHDSGDYQAAVDKGYATATRSLKAQLRKHPRKPAVVLDIDETTLSNYACFDAADFELIGLADCAVNAKGVAFAAAKRFIALAQRRKVAVFFITGTRDNLRTNRLKNIRKVGIHQPYTLITRDEDDERESVVPYKSGERKRLQKRGYRILVNIGDQQSDLAGGAARKTVKLPNPIYLIT
jgi:predicted secreted acid phosphatase